jgi:hypothetical protein
MAAAADGFLFHRPIDFHFTLHNQPLALAVSAGSGWLANCD